jgi:hypothetical protein
MRLITSCLLLASSILLPAASHAAQTFFCGNADVRIEVVARKSPIAEERADAVVTVSLRGVETILRYRSIDFVGGQCLAQGVSRPLVIFQAHCGGSSCQDLENWGVIDPETLRVLVVPGDSNRREVQKLIGTSSLPNFKKISVVGEAEKQGVEVP